ncbi:MAG: FtsL-like putative cell division protein [Bacteroidota bacterium]|nr:FtsL-like putative cell division protein [Bacteroidota bacterium]
MNKFMKILSGDFLSNDFIKNNRKYLVFLLLIIFSIILLSSYGDLKAGKKDSLKKEIIILREKSVTYEALLMQQNLQSTVLEQINRRNIGLIKQKEPIKIIFITKDKLNER